MKPRKPKTVPPAKREKAELERETMMAERPTGVLGGEKLA